jgi:hypothetical protein
MRTRQFRPALLRRSQVDPCPAYFTSRVQQGLDLVAGTDEEVRSGRLLHLGMRAAADLAG